MVKLVNGGITVEVNEIDVDRFKRAGFSVVEPNVPDVPDVPKKPEKK